MTRKSENEDILSIIKSGVTKGLRIVNIRSKEVYGTVLIKNREGNLSRNWVNRYLRCSDLKMISIMIA